ncbi:sodium/proton antiporter, CPA1 family [Klebsiella quasipneumoniae]|uniref:Na+/H+ antiporter n=1 Tax=Klebsiella quasipneumoniae TaxID=1463165 RepID=UPI00087693EF|nr:Na+/H+ antiporter [Klebsiella quasipneumoniae]SCW32359.1 sodium/proton antiporter, CPA1 family [Klebsiella quasipneumoniae]SCY55350.1 sodium/proton antiporter, CPA1 family [Klebsiella quasipneumoniae]SCZ50380.1 sodium/proton antiporter, CPA1 family [Klebsiella quasipneumoniae]SDB41850.1 sodium/proton antiporter, CPA1 family [Klebsiella quasipneumoniae]SDZ81094.1 sodium/proton antiporter, CPA1 family [Klebsiella quasipneumoniae]
MSLIAIVLVFMMAIVVTVFISHLLPVKVPLPLIQIAAGAALAAGGFQVDFDPHIFLLLFIPPLLFLDGWRIPKDAFFRDMKPILSLAIGLVMVTILGIGLFIHWLIPAITVAAGFALAAILSPTDPVAVSAMTASSPLPSRMAHILEGESLLNDASGLVAFNFAIAAVLTGSFSPGEAVMKFFLMAFGGILSGLVVVWVTGKCNNFLVRRTREEPAIQILISLLIPFAAYLLAEAFHVSGILAAVAAGIAMHYEQLSGPRLPATRMKSSAVWSMLQTTLNGMIFLMLGEQLPRMLRTLPAVASQAGVPSPWYLLLYAVAITLALGLMRFAWVWLSMTLTIFRRKRRGKAITVRPRLSILAVMALAGVKGSVTLAGILTLPAVLADGSPFPGRELLIFLSMAVILMSLVVAAIGLPFMTRYLADDLPHDTGKDDIGAVMTEVAINRLNALLDEPVEDPTEQALRADAGNMLLETYQRRLHYNDNDEGQDVGLELAKRARLEKYMQREVIIAQRQELFRLRRAHNISDITFYEVLREIDLKEESLR